MEFFQNHYTWRERFVIAVIWVALGWIVWDFIHWIDPPYRIAPAQNPPRISSHRLGPIDSP